MENTKYVYIIFKGVCFFVFQSFLGIHIQFIVVNHQRLAQVSTKLLQQPGDTLPISTLGYTSECLYISRLKIFHGSNHDFGPYLFDHVFIMKIFKYLLYLEKYNLCFYSILWEGHPQMLRYDRFYEGNDQVVILSH